MSRGFDAAAEAELSQPIVYPVGLAEFDFVSGISRAWTGFGDLVWDARTFQGVGELGQVTSIEETAELKATGVTVTLSGIPGELVATAMDHADYAGRRATFYYALLSESGALVGEPVQIWSGYMDQMIGRDGKQAVLTLRCENQFRDFTRARTRRYTDADQQSEYAGDRFFEYVPSLQDLTVQWGE